MNKYKVQVLGGERHNCIHAEFTVTAECRIDAEARAMTLYTKTHCHDQDTLWLLTPEATLIEAEVAQ